MKPIRQAKVAAFIRNELARIILQELRDPRIGIVSITRVEPTEDLKEAKVYISSLGTPADQRKALRGLDAARGYLQSQLGKLHRWRNNPVLRFELDESYARQTELEAIIREARASDEAGHGSDPSTDSESASGDRSEEQ